jgi:flavin-dependent thymidylate synthase
MMSDETRMTNYVDKAMFAAEPIEQDAQRAPRVHLVSATPDPLGAIAAACRMYEGKATYSLSDVTDEERKHYWGQVQKTHLKAPLEFVDLHFFIEGVTRAFTHQMVRQRTAVYAQESMRFAVKDEIAARPGPLVSSYRKRQEVWDDAISEVWDAYNTLIAMGVPAEEARGLLPHDTLTRLNYKTNLRNLLDHAGNRLCTQAQFEWRFVFAGIVKEIREQRPQWPAPDRTSWQWELIVDSAVFKPVCYQLGHCPFTADFDRGCTIRDRVQAGEFEKINDKEWMMDPTAGWER